MPAGESLVDDPILNKLVDGEDATPALVLVLFIFEKMFEVVVVGWDGSLLGFPKLNVGTVEEAFCAGAFRKRNIFSVLIN